MLNRITSAEEKTETTVNWNQTYTCDRYGNRNFNENLTTTLPKGCVDGSTAVVCEADKKMLNPDLNASDNRMAAGQGWAYDAVGNVITDPEGRTFAYDAENKQTEVQDSSSQTIGEYFLDGDGKRVKKHVPSTGEVTVFVYDAGGKLVAEYSTIVASTNDATVAYLTNDHLSSPRITTDQFGQIASRRDFMPYGEEIARQNYGADSIRQKFTSYLRDTEIVLDYAGARYHDFSLGRFRTPDNFLNDTRTSDSQSWNLYVYARNNPLYYVDPFGEKIYVGYITSDEDRDKFLQRVNFTYGCEDCVTIDADGYLAVDTSGLDEAIVNATQFLTDAINSDDPSKLFTVEITNNNNAVAFGDSGTRRGVAVRQADGSTVTISAVNIRLDFGGDVHVRGGEDVRASFLNLVFAHEISHFYPTYKRDPTVPGVRGPVDNPINEIRLALGLPLRGEYQARRLHVGSTVYLRFGLPVRFPFGGPLRGSDGLEVEMNRIVLWIQDNVKR